MSLILIFVICRTPKLIGTCGIFPSIYLTIFPASSQQHQAPIFPILKMYSVGSHLTMAVLTPLQPTIWLLILLPQKFSLVARNGFGNSTPSLGWYIFLWLACHDHLPTKLCLLRRNITTNDLCPLCKSEPESVIHTLRDCFHVKPL